MASESGLRSTLASKLRPRSNIANLLLSVTPPRGRDLAYREHDRRVTGAPAKMPRKHFTHLLLRGSRLACEEIGGRHQDSGGAKAALQCVVPAKRRLQIIQGIALRETFDGVDVTAFDLYRQCQARAHGAAIEAYRAGAAYAMLTADVRPGCAECLAQEVRQQRARFGPSRARQAIQRQRDAMAGVRVVALHCCACRRTWPPSTRTRWRRYCAVACASSSAPSAHAKSFNASANATPSRRGQRRTTGRSATPPTASSNASALATAASATSAKSPWRDATSRNA